MDDLLGGMMASLREGQMALDEELRPLLQAQNPDWSMLERLRDVVDDYAGRARRLRQTMTARGAEDEVLEEGAQLCTYFDRSAGLIAQETGDAEDAVCPPTGDKAGGGEVAPPWLTWMNSSPRCLPHCRRPARRSGARWSPSPRPLP